MWIQDITLMKLFPLSEKTSGLESFVHVKGHLGQCLKNYG